MRGALVLLGGDPGVGKSTLMLDVAAHLASSGPVLYASGEESAQQIKMRGERMNVRTSDLHIYAEMSVEKILGGGREARTRRSSSSIPSKRPSARNSKWRQAASARCGRLLSQLLFWTKKNHVPVFLIGHITKDGAIAGPKALEHIVDTVLYFEGPRQHPHRIVRTIKNRFGAANELGIFEMASSGLRPWKSLPRFSFRRRSPLNPGSACSAAWRVQGPCWWRFRRWFRERISEHRDGLQPASILNGWRWSPQFWKRGLA